MFKRNEDKILAGIKQYIESTYSAHYSSDSGRDVIDDWEDMGIAKPRLDRIVSHRAR